MTAPLSMVASLEPPVAVSPLTPGVVWVTVKVILGGIWMDTGLPSMYSA